MTSFSDVNIILPTHMHLNIMLLTLKKSVSITIIEMDIFQFQKNPLLNPSNAGAPNSYWQEASFVK